MNNYFYFTFGSAGQLYRGGWVKIKAETLKEAQDKFKDYYGSKAYKDGGFGSLNYCLNYSFPYSEWEFKQTGLGITGNLGARCHNVID